MRRTPTTFQVCFAAAPCELADDLLSPLADCTDLVRFGIGIGWLHKAPSMNWSLSGMTRIIRCWPKLTHFTLDCDHRITQAKWAALSPVDASAIEMFANYCPGLTHLELPIRLPPRWPVWEARVPATQHTAQLRLWVDGPCDDTQRASVERALALIWPRVDLRLCGSQARSEHYNDLQAYVWTARDRLARSPLRQ